MRTTLLLRIACVSLVTSACGTSAPATTTPNTIPATTAAPATTRGPLPRSSETEAFTTIDEGCLDGPWQQLAFDGGWLVDTAPKSPEQIGSINIDRGDRYQSGRQVVSDIMGREFLLGNNDLELDLYCNDQSGPIGAMSWTWRANNGEGSTVSIQHNQLVSPTTVEALVGDGADTAETTTFEDLTVVTHDDGDAHRVWIIDETGGLTTIRNAPDDGPGDMDDSIDLAITLHRAFPDIQPVLTIWR